MRTGLGSTRRAPSAAVLVLGLVGGIALAGCASPAGSAAGASSPPASATSVAGVAPSTAAPAGSMASAAGETAAPLGACTAGGLATRTAETLTIATGPGASAPWVVGDPAGGQGLEAAVGVAVARGLGYDAGHTRWVTADRTQALAGRTDGFDLDLDRFTATELTAAPVDASSGYFGDADTVLVPAAADTPQTLAALSGMRLAEVAGADASTVARDTGLPATVGVVDDPAVALADGSAQAVVLPLTGALAAAATDPSLRVLGQVRSSSTQPDQLVALLAADSPLTPCVSAALDRLRVEGTLDQLAATWVPVTVLR